MGLSHIVLIRSGLNHHYLTQCLCDIGQETCHLRFIFIIGKNGRGVVIALTDCDLSDKACNKFEKVPDSSLATTLCLL